jgi:hypothetical protein
MSPNQIRQNALAGRIATQALPGMAVRYKATDVEKLAELTEGK